VLQLLEEHHLCAWSPDKHLRRQFVNDLSWHLRHLRQTQVCILDGTKITDLSSVCSILEAQLGTGRIAREIDSPLGVVGSLRRRPSPGGSEPIKSRYYIWSEAHQLLRRDPDLFGRLVDALAGVAADEEYVSEDLLLLHRAVFVGGPSLDVYAEDPRGQFRRWWSDRGEPGFWQVRTGVAAPKLVSRSIEALTGA
ncbi:MAG: hypothetical protein ACK4WH_06060, partial [Phycisphaerales bacterium]